PTSIKSVIQGRNIFENAQMDPEAKKFLKRLKTLEVRDGKLILELNEEYEAELDNSTDFEGVNAL
ncbi:MAG: hypothetical protein HOH33_06770, partial [Verrucomicrobia bacterium]|nr:hypothetical protein [Verrucomicrobiota bacterium]